MGSPGSQEAPSTLDVHGRQQALPLLAHGGWALGPGSGFQVDALPGTSIASLPPKETGLETQTPSMGFLALPALYQ